MSLQSEGGRRFRTTPEQPCRPRSGAGRDGDSRRRRSARASLLLLAAPVLLGGWNAPARAGVLFQNCVTGSDGAITCDTVPTGNTLMNDLDARYGLLNNASAGWSEFDPYGGYGDEFGDEED